jgi:hypothetical protein
MTLLEESSATMPTYAFSSRYAVCWDSVADMEDLNQKQFTGPLRTGYPGVPYFDASNWVASA